MLRLYQCFGFEPNEKGAPTRLAEQMNTSPQMITNWSARGVSKDGAIDAERRTGRSAAWILFGDTFAYSESQSSGAVLAREPSAPDFGWPFKKISRKQWKYVDAQTRERVEDVILAMIRPAGPDRQQGASIEEAWH